MVGKVEPGIAQPFVRLTDLVMPLHLLGADIEDTYGRLLDAKNGACISFAHNREGNELCRVCFKVRADIQHDAPPPKSRPRRGHCRTVHAIHLAQDQHGDRHQGTRIARRNCSARVAIFNVMNSIPHRGSLAAPKGLAGFHVAGHMKIGVNDFDTLRRFGQERLQLSFVTMQTHGGIRTRRKKELCARDRHIGGLVAPHCVNCQY